MSSLPDFPPCTVPLQDPTTFASPTRARARSFGQVRPVGGPRRVVESVASLIHGSCACMWMCVCACMYVCVCGRRTTAGHFGVRTCGLEVLVQQSAATDGDALSELCLSERCQVTSLPFITWFDQVSREWMSSYLVFRSFIHYLAAAARVCRVLLCVSVCACVLSSLPGLWPQLLCGRSHQRPRAVVRLGPAKRASATALPRRGSAVACCGAVPLLSPVHGRSVQRRWLSARRAAAGVGRARRRRHRE